MSRPAVQYIDTPDGPIPIPLAIPQPGAPVHIPRLGDLYTWDDVDRWAGDALSAAHDLISAGVDLFSSAADLTVNNVRAMIRSALDIQVEAYSGFINLVFNYTTDAFNVATGTIEALSAFTIGDIADIYSRLLGLSEFVYGVALDTAGAIDNLRLEIDRLVYDTFVNTVNGIEAWAIDNIYHPLLDYVKGEVGALQWEIGAGVGALSTELDALKNVTIPNIIADLFAVAGIATAVEAWVNDCGDPMCASFGPGTDLGKALQALKGLLGLLAGLAVADLNEKQLEAMAELFTRLSSTAATDFFDAFVVGGETIGQSGGVILGDLGDIGIDVLRELGLPV